MTKLSIIIKALNEEKNIARTLESIICASHGLDTEIVLADSLSTDHTVEIAKRYPVTIVQLASTQDRGLGSGVQLAYQSSCGDFLYLIDGDMSLDPKFLRTAIQALDNDPRIAGVAGLERYMNATNPEFKVRELQKWSYMRPGLVDYLGGGGLYRRRAIESVSYMGDRNLHGHEEFELGLRLRHRGWKLQRLDMIAIDHHDHTDSTIRLLWRRWKSRYAASVGELVRATAGTPYFGEVLMKVRLLQLSVLIYFWIAVLAFLAISGGLYAWLAAIAVAVLPFVVMTIRRKSLSLGVYSVAFWCIFATGTIRGLLSHRIDPKTPIPYGIIKGTLRQNEQSG